MAVDEGAEPKRNTYRHKHPELPCLVVSGGQETLKPNILEALSWARDILGERPYQVVSAVDRTVLASNRDLRNRPKPGRPIRLALPETPL